MNDLVVDGSVAANWCLPEPGCQAADLILAARFAGERELLAPDLIAPELADLLWKHVRGREHSRSKHGR